MKNIFKKMVAFVLSFIVMIGPAYAKEYFGTQDFTQATITASEPTEDYEVVNKKYHDENPGSGAAPSDANFFVGTSNLALTNEFNFGSLSSGLIKHTVSGGISTPATAIADIDYLTPGTAAGIYVPYTGATSAVNLGSENFITLGTVGGVNVTSGNDPGHTHSSSSITEADPLSVHKDGSVELTANWDAGSYKITAETLESDVATGTSPLTIASATLVSNLNSDLLDSQEGSYYLDSANFTGTDWTDLTDGGDTTLHIHDSRYFTETEIIASYVPYTGANSDTNLGSYNLTTTGSISGINVTSGTDPGHDHTEISVAIPHTDLTDMPSSVNTDHDGRYVRGPASSIDENLAIFDSTTGRLIKDSELNIDRVRNLLSTAWLSGGDISINVDPTKFDVSAGTGIVVDNSDPLNPVVTPVSFGPYTGVTPSFLTTDPFTFVSVDANGDLVQKNVISTNEELRVSFDIGGVGHPDGATITQFSNFSAVVPYDVALWSADFANSFSIINTSGNVYSANGSNLKIDRSAGEVFATAIALKQDPDNPNAIVTSADTEVPFLTTWDNGAGNWNISSGLLTDLPVDRWDDKTGGVSQPNGTIEDWQFQSFRAFYSADADLTVIQYGQKLYNNLTSAINDATAEPVVRNPALNGLLYRGAIIARGDATDLSDPDQAYFQPASKFNVFDLGPSKVNEGVTNMAAFGDGAVVDTADVQVSSNGSTITMSVERDGGGDLVVQLNEGKNYILDTTPAATITLTAGTDSNPQLNYVYVTESGGTVSLQKSTSSFPDNSVSYAPIGTFFAQSASTTQSSGVLKLHAWTDHMGNGRGHLSHLNERWRQENASHDTGTEGSVVIDATPTPDDVYAKNTSGYVYQLHRQAFPLFDMTQYDIDAVNTTNETFTISDDGDLTSAFPDGRFINVNNSTGNDGLYTVSSTVYSAPDFTITVGEDVTSAVADGTIGDDIHVVNDPVDPYDDILNLNTQTSDALGVSLSNRSFSFVHWGVQNETDSPSHIMLNLPVCSYTRLAPDNAVQDADNCSVYDIPKAFRGVGFLIARYTFQLDATGNIWTLYDTEDLTGKVPNNVAGGGGGGGGGVSTFLGLTDTPSSYSGMGEYLVRVAGGETALEFFDKLGDWLGQYVLGAGRSGGQTITGGTLTTEDLTLEDNEVDGNTITVSEIISKGDGFVIDSGVVRENQATTGDYATDDYVFGSPQLDDDADSTHDNRIIFDKNKGYFAAGGAQSTNWDNANRGSFGISLGNNNKASGNQSVAIGGSNISSSLLSVAIGGSSVASGLVSTAFTSSTASGSYSFSTGLNTEASASASSTFGQAFENNQKYSLAVGYGTGDASPAGLIRLEADADQDDTKKSAIYIGSSAGSTTQTNRIENIGGFLNFEGNPLLENIVEDTTPQLGADLDGQEYGIDNIGDITHDDATASDWIFKNEDLDKDIIFNINDGGVDTEFMRIDASANRLGVGTDAPGAKVDVYSNTESVLFRAVGDDSGGAVFVFNAYNNSARFNARRYGGTVASPSAISNNNVIFRSGGGGEDGTGNPITNNVQIDFRASENFSATGHGARIEMGTTPIGSTTRAINMTIADDGGIFAQNLLGSTGGSDVRYNTTTKEIFYDTSSRRYKENITELEPSESDWFYDLDWKCWDDARIGSHECGLIAEELEAVAPELINYKIYQYTGSESTGTIISQEEIDATWGDYQKLERDYINISDCWDDQSRRVSYHLLQHEVEDEEGGTTIEEEWVKTIRLPEGYDESQLMAHVAAEIQDFISIQIKSIVSGEITAARGDIELMAEGGVADELTTINGCSETNKRGKLEIYLAEGSEDVTIKNSVGKMKGDMTLDDYDSVLVLRCRKGQWIELERSANH
jgi:hypothetical protein